MADFVIICLFILVNLLDHPALAAYCYGSYNTYYYSFYCSGTCCGTSIRYCCNESKDYLSRDAIIAAVVLGIMIVIVITTTICLVVIKKCNRRQIQTGIVISTASYISRDNVYPANARFYDSFQLPAYSPATDPPKYESTPNLRAPIEENISQNYLDGQDTQTNVISNIASSDNVITSVAPSDHNQILDSEL